MTDKPPAAQNLVETVARSICAVLLRNIFGSEPTDEMIEEAWQHDMPAANAAISTFLDAIAEPSEAQMAAANALPITKAVDSLIVMTATRYGDVTTIPGAPDTPLQQWYRAMIAALQGELDAKPTPRLPTTESVGSLVARKCRNHPPCDCPGDERCAPPRCWVED